MDLLQFVRGCTFDDFLLAPQFGVLARRDPDAIDLAMPFSQHLTLNRPLVAANMDTVTRSAMAIVLAEEGGIGIIDRGFRSDDIQPQVAEVAAVKRTQHGVIADPHTIDERGSVADAIRLMERTGVGTLVVVDAERRLTVSLTRTDVRFVPGDARLAERMTARDSWCHQSRLVARRRTADDDAQGQEASARQRRRNRAGPHHGQGSAEASAASLRHQRSQRPPARRRRRRRHRRLSRTGHRGAAGRSGRAGHRYRPRTLAGDGTGDRRDSPAVRRRGARRRERRHR